MLDVVRLNAGASPFCGEIPASVARWVISLVASIGLSVRLRPGHPGGRLGITDWAGSNSGTNSGSKSGSKSGTSDCHRSRVDAERAHDNRHHPVAWFGASAIEIPATWVRQRLTGVGSLS